MTGVQTCALPIYSGSVVGGCKSLVEFFCQDTLNPKVQRSPTNEYNQTRNVISLIDLGVSHWLSGKPKRTQLEYPSVLFTPYILQASLSTCGNCGCALLRPCGKYATYDVMHAVYDVVLLPCGHRV